MENKRPLILVTNDDGYRTKRIKSHIDYLSEFADVVCVAPVEQHSANSDTTQQKCNDFIKRLHSALPLLGLYLLLLALPCCLKLDESGSFHFAKVWFATGLIGAIFPATLLWLISCRYRWCKIVIATLLWALFLIDFILFSHFDTRLSDRIIYLVLQTNRQETSEFLYTYLFTLATLKGLATGLLLALTYLSVKKIFQISSWRPKTAGRFIAGLAICNIVSAVVLCLSSFTNILKNQLAENTLQNLYQSCREVSLYSADITRLEAAVRSCDGEIDVSIYPAKVPDIVFIIGESYNPNHSPLYGYRLMTTPGLVAERDSGNLLVLDAVTPFPATGKVMEVLYSPTEANVGTARWDSPLVPTLFKHAGYVVSLHDNQCTRVFGDSKWDLGNCQFLNSTVVETASFDYRNRDILNDDLAFCNHELNVIESLRKADTPSLSIIHLYGQHSPAKIRYPDSFSPFSAEDYAWRQDITPQQAMEIAYYDNATAYNDSVVCRILKSFSKRDAVVVYVADHGEEVHDFRNQYGRTMGTITKGIAENIYRVPLLIYITPEFRRNHDTIYQMLQSVGNQKIYTGDIGQLLLHLGGIKTRFRDPHRSPLSPQYSSGSRCILDGKVDYDKLLQEQF